jgi:hypothetical protein
MQKFFLNLSCLCKIWGFHGGDYDDYHLLGDDAVWLMPTFLILIKIIVGLWGHLPVCLCVSSPSSLVAAWWTHSCGDEYTCNNGRIIGNIIFCVVLVVSKEIRWLILHKTSCLIKEKSCRGHSAQPDITSCYVWVMQGSCLKWMTDDSVYCTPT